MMNLSTSYEEVTLEAKKCAEKAMSLSQLTASYHAVTYFHQMRPALALEDVVAAFRQAYAEKRAELAELDRYDED